MPNCALMAYQANIQEYHERQRFYMASVMLKQ
jgi:hypothetical protein